MLSVIIPANNEARYIASCLAAVLGQSLSAEACGGVQIIVAANACTDDTVAIAQGFADQARARGYELLVLDIAEGGKPNALNQADAVASGDMRAYLDADVLLSPDLLQELVAVLSDAAPLYASGRLNVAPASSWVTRAFAKVWQRLPFMTQGVPGAGLFAVNAAGRARWGAFPDIISDDTFVRMQFPEAERVAVRAGYEWPLVEGFGALVRVRHRQDLGVQQVAALYPDIMENEGKERLGASGALRLFLSMPISFGVYCSVLICVKVLARTGRGQTGWTRGR